MKKKTSARESLQLLNSIEVGKILFQNQPQLNKQQLIFRIMQFRKKNGLPMKYLQRKYYISLGSLEKWIKEQGL